MGKFSGKHLAQLLGILKVLKILVGNLRNYTFKPGRNCAVKAFNCCESNFIDQGVAALLPQASL